MPCQHGAEMSNDCRVSVVIKVAKKLSNELTQKEAGIGPYFKKYLLRHWCCTNSIQFTEVFNQKDDGFRSFIPSFI